MLNYNKKTFYIVFFLVFDELRMFEAGPILKTHKYHHLKKSVCLICTACTYNVHTCAHFYVQTSINNTLKKLRRKRV